VEWLVGSGSQATGSDLGQIVVRCASNESRESYRGLAIFRANIMLECAPDSGQVVGWELTGPPGFPRMEAMAKHHTYGIEFKLQVAQNTLQARLCMRWRSVTISPAT